ncbi:hypothetical protein [Glaciecola sp. SC05]|uniref:hypothetical protein n=1 Tax=Glaciecola sp. SC05 TaxID=1987355 RepID=UPI003526DC04
MKPTLRLILIAGALFSVSSNADPLKDAADKLCNKMKQCIVEEISAEDDLDEQTKQIATSMANSMCESLYQFDFVKEHGDLYDGMLACYNSVSEQKCADLMDGFETPECEAFEQIAEQYSN